VWGLGVTFALVMCSVKAMSTPNVVVAISARTLGHAWSTCSSIFFSTPQLLLSWSALLSGSSSSWPDDLAAAKKFYRHDW
jgi:hypothetical protein